MQQWYQCPSCGAPVAFGTRFCTNCGLQLNWATQQQVQPPPVYQQQQQSKGGKMKVLAGILIAIIIALVVGFAPIMEVPYTDTVQYQDTETYYENEPYEEYIDVQVPLEYQRVTGGGASWTEDRTIINRDTVAGYFTLRQTIYVIDNEDWADLEWDIQEGLTTFDTDQRVKRYDIEDKIYLEPNEQGTLQWQLQDIDPRPPDEVHIERLLPSPEIITDEKTISTKVTKYRQVEKERTITKQHPETRYKKVTLLEYLLHH